MKENIDKNMNEEETKDEEIFSNEEEQDKNIKDNKDDEIIKLQNELSEITDKFYRANADFENMKKRLEKEKIIAVSYAGESFAKDMLPIIDALEEALKIEVENNEFAKNIKKGVEHCANMILNVFEKQGVKQISTDGKFDPNFHNAISQIESEELESGDIAQVYQKGYMYKDRVLRPSMVVVVK